MILDFFQKKEQPLKQTKPKKKQIVKIRIAMDNGEIYWGVGEEGQTIDDCKKSFKVWIEKARKEDKEMLTETGWIYTKNITSIRFYGDEYVEN